MAVGRASHQPGGEAIGVLNLDSLPAVAALKDVAAHGDILSTAVIELPPAGQLPVWLLGPSGG
jgi:D-3-phosphoglycerate dehydrogenase